MITTTFQHTGTNIHTRSSDHNFLTTFLNWCSDQQENRLLWLGIALAGYGCVLTPMTIIAVVLAGVNMGLFTIAMLAMTINLVVNLAALPTKITIPVLIFSVIADIAVLISCAVIGFDASYAF